MSTTVSGSAPSRRKPLRKVKLSVRRAIVLTMYGGCVAAPALWRSSRTHHSGWLAAAAFAVLAAAVAAALAAFYRTGYWKWGIASDSTLDERQRAVRNLIYGYCYAIVFGVLLLAILYCEIAADAHWWLPDPKLDAHWIFWDVLAIGLTLPSAILAWVEQPPPDEE